MMSVHTPATMVAGTSHSEVGRAQALTAIDTVYDLLATLVTPVAEVEEVDLRCAIGRILAVAQKSPHPLPRFDHSAVDGFGVGEEAIGLSQFYTAAITGDVAAGQEKQVKIGTGEAIRLFTGAKIPDGVCAVVMHEKTSTDGDRTILPPGIGEGDNIRRAGEDIGLDETIVPAGCVLDSRHVAILATAGYGSAYVKRRVRLAIVSTGDELVPAGGPLGASQIYDVNGPMLSALAVGSVWIEPPVSEHVRDDGSQLTATFSRLATNHDVIICTGGAAGSQTDHTADAISGAGGLAHPLGIALKPGKPVVLGKLDNCLILGFPGNPIAALVNFLLFGRPAMFALGGAAMKRPKGIPVDIDGDLVRSADRTEFAPAKIVRYGAAGRPVAARLGKAGSGRLMPLVNAEGLLEIPPAIAGQIAATFHPFDSSISV